MEIALSSLFLSSPPKGKEAGIRDILGYTEKSNLNKEDWAVLKKTIVYSLSKLVPIT